MNVLDKTMIAPCGMNCGICMAYLRDKNVCKGCWAPKDSKSRSCVACIIKHCELLNKLDSKFCYDCEKYPCKRLKQLDKRYRTKYHMSMIDNLNNIKTYGLDEFVQKENDRWLCKNCGGTICVHRGFCTNCKTEYYKITQ
jgi:hypothetical protein